MVQEVRSSQSRAAFDFNSQAGVTRVLHAVRKSDVSLAVKNELRDLVFLFANSGGDTAVRNTLEEQLRVHNIQYHPPVAGDTDATSAPVATVHHGFASGRPAPSSFSTQPISATGKMAADLVVPSAQATPTKPTVVKKITPKSHGDIPAQESDTSTEPVTAAVQSDMSSKPVSPAEKTQTEPSVIESVPAVTTTNAIDTKVAPNNVPATSPDTTPADVSSVDGAATAALERIKNIKGDVNKTFGNPVNLVDINKEVGREYMSALLEAMKILANGSPIAIKEAMDRLETVYTEITKIDYADIRSTQTVKSAPAKSDATVQSVPTPTQPAPVADAARIPIVSSPSQSAVAKSGANTQNNDKDEFRTTPVALARDATGTVKSAKVATNSMSVPPVAASVKHDDGVQPTPAAPAAAKSYQSAASSVVSKGSDAPGFATSVADAPPLHTPNDLPDPKVVANASVNGDPLYTPQIDAGLEQLLLEWSLFNKSGLFGTGPKGREHPLFKKLADLQIPLILAGRFEGANPAIKQSVTDYMNGWRYEQGILYEKGETFEQYLRRVIKHIIDWQEKKTGS